MRRQMLLQQTRKRRLKWSFASNSRLVENRSDTVGKEQLASLAFRSDSMLAVDGCSLVFLEGRVFN